MCHQLETVGRVGAWAPRGQSRGWSTGERGQGAPATLLRFQTCLAAAPRPFATWQWLLLPLPGLGSRGTVSCEELSPPSLR